MFVSGKLPLHSNFLTPGSPPKCKDTFLGYYCVLTACHSLVLLAVEIRLTTFIGHDFGPGTYTITDRICVIMLAFQLLLAMAGSANIEAYPGDTLHVYKQAVHRSVDIDMTCTAQVRGSGNTSGLIRARKAHAHVPRFPLCCALVCWS